jgi:hypothetical protein
MSKKSADESKPTAEPSSSLYTLVAVSAVDDILHKTFTSLEELNSFVKDEIAGSEPTSLVFVVNGTLVPESEWNPPDQTDQVYWTII